MYPRGRAKGAGASLLRSQRRLSRGNGDRHVPSALAEARLTGFIGGCVKPNRRRAAGLGSRDHRLTGDACRAPVRRHEVRRVERRERRDKASLGAPPACRVRTAGVIALPEVATSGGRDAASMPKQIRSACLLPAGRGWPPLRGLPSASEAAAGSGCHRGIRTSDRLDVDAAGLNTRAAEASATPRQPCRPLSLRRSGRSGSCARPAHARRGFRP